MTIHLESLATTVAFCFFAGAMNQEIHQNEMLLDSTLRLLSFAGAIGGGFMALAFFPTQRIHDKQSMLKADAVRWIACSLFGGSFSPIIAEHILPRHGLPLTTSTVLATSAFLGMFAWLLVAGLHHFIKSKFPKL